MQFVVNQIGTQNALSATTGAAVGVTLPTSRQNPTHAIIQVASNSIRWRADGTAPTSTSGILVASGANIEFMDPNFNYESIVKNFKAIGISGTATIEIAFFAT